MISVNERQWTQFMVGIDRNDVGPFKQKNRANNNDSWREYYEGDELVASMFTKNCNTPTKEYHPVDQTFNITQSLLNAVEYIYIPTNEELKIWDDPINEHKYNITEIISTREQEWKDNH